MKTGSITAATLVAVIFFFSGVRAQERTTSHGSHRHVSVSSSQVVNGDYFAFGDSVEIAGTINGDLYASGGQVVIDGRVNGDVLVAGGRLSLSGTVSQNVRAAGGQVTITGNIGRNLTVAGGNVEVAPSALVKGGVVAAGGNIDLSAPIEGAAKVAAGTLNVGNRIGADLDAAVGTLRLASKAAIQGNVNYWSSREASISEGTHIAGKIVRNVPPEKPRFFKAALVAWLIFVAINFVSTLILGLLSVRFFPSFHQSVVRTLRDRPWAALGIGFIAAVALPVACAILFATIIAIPLGLIFLSALFILLYWSRLYAITRIGEAILARLRPASSRTAAFVLGLFVYYIIALVPIIGWFVVALVMLFGLGAELVARKRLYLAARNQNLV